MRIYNNFVHLDLSTPYMQSIFKINTYRLSFHFYRKFMWTPILLSGIIWYINNSLLGISFAHILFFILIYFSYFESSMRKQLDFYQNFGISKLVLFVISTCYSLICGVLAYHILNLF